MDHHHRRPGDPVPFAPTPAPTRPPTPAASPPARATSPASSGTAADVCRRYQPSDEAKALLGDDQPPDAFASALIDAGLGADAVEFLAHRLPRRESVWWGCLCAWESARPAPIGAEDDAFRAAVRWVIDPGEPNRLAAARAGNAAGMQTSAGLLALAASWSGGSMAPDGLPVAAPPDDLTARTVFAALRLASARDPGGAMLRFARMGLEAPTGPLRWDG